MLASSHLNASMLAGALLILGFVSFAIGASLPTFTPNGNFRIFTLPLRDYLAAVARIPVAWRWANIFMGAAAVIQMAGLTILTTSLAGRGERILSPAGLAAWLLAAGLWLSLSAFRASVTLAAAQEMVEAGAAPAANTVPTYYAPLAQWVSALFIGYVLLGILSLVLYGGSLLQTALLPAWAGWATILWSFAMLVMLIATGDTLPVFHYFPPLLLGILLLLRG